MQKNILKVVGVIKAFKMITSKIGDLLRYVVVFPAGLSRPGKSREGPGKSREGPGKVLGWDRT